SCGTTENAETRRSTKCKGLPPFRQWWRTHFAEPSVSGVISERFEGALVRELGVWGLTASIVNITIGGGIFRLPAAAATQLGAAAPIAFIVCAIAMCLIVL